MPNYRLFLGLPVDRLLSQELNKISPEVRSIFIQNGSDYLHQIHHNENEYLGKFINPPFEFASLELLETNILSLFKKLFPDFHPKKSNMILFSIDVENF